MHDPPRADLAASAGSDFFWSATDVLEHRYEKSAAALIAIRDVLNDEHPLGGAEDQFLRSYDWIIRQDPILFTKVWTSPYAYFWVRIAYQLLASCISGTSLPAVGQQYCRATGCHTPAEALAHHLVQFQRFPLALAYLDGQDIELATPLVVELPLALPGATVSIEGSGTITLTGTQDQQLLARSGERSTAVPPWAPNALNSAAVAPCPIARHNECELALQPAIYNLSGLDFVGPVVTAGLEFQRAHVALVQDALALVQRHHPVTFRQLRDHVEIIALKPLRSGNYTNITYSDLPGAFIAAVIPNPYEFADTLIHEHHHSRLFCIEEFGPFFSNDGPDAVRDSAFYSPWRDDLRPLHGILHAVYVFTPVWNYWLSVARDDSTPPAIRDYAIERLARVHLQCALGLDQLDRYGALTEDGTRLVAELRQRVGDMAIRLREYRSADILPALRCNENGAIVNEVLPNAIKQSTVLECVRFHVTQFAPPDQHARLLSIAVPPN